MRPAYGPLSVTLHPQCREKVTAAASAAVTSTPLVQPGQVEGLQRDTCGGGNKLHFVFCCCQFVRGKLTIREVLSLIFTAEK